MLIGGLEIDIAFMLIQTKLNIAGHSFKAFPVSSIGSFRPGYFVVHFNGGTGNRFVCIFGFITTGLVAAFTLGVTINVAGSLTYGFERSSIRTNILGNRAVNHHYVTHRNVGLARYPLLIVQIVGLIDIEFTGAVLNI